MKIPGLKFMLTVIAVGASFASAPAGFAFTAASGDDVQVNSVAEHPLAGPGRPANVPDGYVITPFGYFHPSCVQSLAKGEKLLADGRIEHADGSAEAKAAVCNFPHYSRGRTLAGGATMNSRDKYDLEAGKTPEINGWVENANATTGSPGKAYGGVIAFWIVPPSPRADDGQTLFFFPGLEDINDAQTSILQPVMAWYAGQWSMASWNCCINGVTTNSPYVGIRTGDVIYGSITNDCGAGAATCPTWTVLTLDLSTGQSTTLSDTPSEGQTFNWAFGGVLEAYSVVRCEDYPPDHKMAFDLVTVFNQNLRPVFDPRWTIGIDSTDTPQCRYGVKPEPHRVALDF